MFRRRRFALWARLLRAELSTVIRHVLPALQKPVTKMEDGLHKRVRTDATRRREFVILRVVGGLNTPRRIQGMMELLFSS